MITKNKVVSVSYELRTQADGEVIERAGAENPLTFVCGYDQTIPQFEMNILGLQEGDNFDFHLTPDNGYGERNEDMVVDLPMNLFEQVEEDMLKVGTVLPMQDSLGRKLNGEIKEINEETLKMDFNHPLAGQDLFFKGNIVTVRDATDEEITNLNAGCGGSCSSCSSCG
jgi:FKBP-type peptidyl-prolyl cis-trans isomerase SlyD